MELKNNEVYDFKINNNLIVEKTKFIIPMIISFVPILVNKNDPTNRMYLDEGFLLLDNNVLTKDYYPILSFTLFKDKDMTFVTSLFLNDFNLLIKEFLTPALFDLMDIINFEGDAYELVVFDMFNDIYNIDTLNEFINVINNQIDNIFIKLNENINEVKDLFIDLYMRLGQIIHSTIVFNNIEKPDKILNFDDGSCGIFKSIFGTSYIIPNGISLNNK